MWPEIHLLNDGGWASSSMCRALSSLESWSSSSMRPVGSSSSMTSITGGLNGAPAGRFLDVSGWVAFGAGVEPVAGYGASPAPFPQFLPRWARAEALDRPTGTTVVALDARRRVPRRPDVVQLDAGEIAGNDRVPLGGRVRSRPRPCSWSTCPARPTTESPQLVDVSGLDRGPAAGRRAPVVTLKNPAQGPRRA